MDFNYLEDEVSTNHFAALKSYIETNCKDEKFTVNINIRFFLMKELCISDTYSNFAHSKFRLISKSKGVKLENESKIETYFYPTISIGLEDIMNEESHSEKMMNLDPRYKFFDSSIWHRYVPLNEDFRTNFKNIVDEISHNYELGLYAADIAKEYLEFETRMMRNSFLANVGKTGHASYVTPFKFHSETEFKKKLEIEKTCHKIPSDIQWKALLIDDHCITQLKGSTNVKLTKKYILENLLSKISAKIEIKGLLDEEILNGEMITKAKECLESKQMYDIHFLDYLLTNTDQKSNPGKMVIENEYGHQLLEKISLTDSLKRKRGPFSKYWFFPISGFSDAMLNELHHRGFSLSNELWNIDNGADPVNTPYLFLYRLHQFMNIQIKEALYEPFEILDFLGNFPISEVPLSTKDIEAMDKKSIPNAVKLNAVKLKVKENAKSLYNNFLYKFGKKESLKFDKDNNSILAISILKFIDNLHVYKAVNPQAEQTGDIEDLVSAQTQIKELQLTKDEIEKFKLSMIFFEAINSFLQKLAYYSSFQWKELLKERNYIDDLIVKYNIYDRLKSYNKNASDKYPQLINELENKINKLLKEIDYYLCIISKDHKDE